MHTEISPKGPLRKKGGPSSTWHQVHREFSTKGRRPSSTGRQVLTDVSVEGPLRIARRNVAKHVFAQRRLAVVAMFLRAVTPCVREAAAVLHEPRQGRARFCFPLAFCIFQSHRCFWTHAVRPNNSRGHGSRGRPPLLFRILYRPHRNEVR